MVRMKGRALSAIGWAVTLSRLGEHLAAVYDWLRELSRREDVLRGRVNELDRRVRQAEARAAEFETGES